MGVRAVAFLEYKVFFMRIALNCAESRPYLLSSDRVARSNCHFWGKTLVFLPYSICSRLAFDT
jgi:hypothetical protein